MSLRDRTRDLLGGVSPDSPAGRERLAARVDGLEAALDACDRHAPVASQPSVVGAREVLDRVGQRVSLSLDHTVVALAGATGSGKSSLFNALCRAEVAAPGVRRPTTTTTSAAVWPPAEDAGPLLDWIGAGRRHLVATGDHTDLTGAVLLDLPDHDSTHTAHHDEVERLSRLVDVFVWVVDPQKYADAALHERFLAPLHRHAERTVVVLNQVDRLPADRVDDVLADLRRLLGSRGLSAARVLAASATRGDGLEELADEIAGRVARRDAGRDRLVADVVAAAEGLGETVGERDAGPLPASRREALVDAYAAAAGVPTVVAAVRTSTRRRGRTATGWPLLSWIGAMRADPLQRLRLTRAGAGSRADDASTQVARSSIPAAGAVERARVDSAVREVVEARCGHLPEPWRTTARAATAADPSDLADDLDRAVTRVDLGVGTLPRWMRGVRVVQWVLLAAALLGAAWLLVGALLDVLVLPLVQVPLDVLGAGGDTQADPVPLPSLLLTLGVVGGVLLALTVRWLVGVSSRRAGRRCERALREAVAEVADDRVLAPLDVVCTDHDTARRAIRAG